MSGLIGGFFRDQKRSGQGMQQVAASHGLLGKVASPLPPVPVRPEPVPVAGAVTPVSAVHSGAQGARVVEDEKVMQSSTPVSSVSRVARAPEASSASVKPSAEPMPGGAVPVASLARERERGVPKEPVTVTRLQDLGALHVIATQVLSGESADVEIRFSRREDAEVVIVLGMAGAGAQGQARCAILWTGEQIDYDALRTTMEKVQRRGLEVGLEGRTDRRLIQELYAGAASVASLLLSPDDPTAQAVKDLIETAVDRRASDIHVQVNPHDSRVLFRVDGDIEVIWTHSREWGVRLARTLYARGADDTKSVLFNEREVQGATIKHTVVKAGVKEEIGLRYASAPVYPSGFDLVMRVLSMGLNTTIPDLPGLGFAPAQVRAILTATERPSGLVALVGTTGSGKSTTITSLVDYLDDYYDGRRIIRSIEDPPEYAMKARQQPVVVANKGEGTEQSRAAEAFTKALKGAMRMDPDVLVIGEIRDAPSAQLAQQATLSGHKVLTTFHASSLTATISRARSYQMDPDVLGSWGFLQAIVRQTLVRKVCPHCAQPFERAKRPAKVRSDYAWRMLRRQLTEICDTKAVCFVGSGCDHCKGTGAKGRTVVAEILKPTWRMLDLIGKGDYLSLEAAWRASRVLDPESVYEAAGLSMEEHALMKIEAGQLCPTEVIAHVGGLPGASRQTGGVMGVRDALDLLLARGHITPAEFEQGTERLASEPHYPYAKLLLSDEEIGSSGKTP